MTAQPSSPMRTFIEFLNRKGGRRRTHHEALFRWEDDIQRVVAEGTYESLTADEKSRLHLKASMLKRVTSFAARQHTLENDFCAWLSAALEGTLDHELRSGLVEVRVAESLLVASTRFRVLDVPGRSPTTKTADFALGTEASIECKRLIGSAKTGGDRVFDADAQHEAARACLAEGAVGVTILCLGRVEDVDRPQVEYIEDVLSEVDGVLAGLENTDAVVIAVESWRISGEVYVADFSVSALLAPGRTIEDSMPEALHGWFEAPIKRLG